ncbi:peroxidase [Geothrix rubra]|uniref:Thioredoxin peroxidase n=1 Tax=Geothrix rubra TaxID=2927977 RepID=A0ABQ5Q7Q9_9BACT|nr:peroxiredoxin [Geothrix rubra]GLH70513.1 peroxidase [Geothrix rubra]
MAAFVTQPAPDFKAKALVNGEFKEISLSDYKGKKVVLFFYPLDFTFVCPTEILAFADAIKEFEARNTQVIGVSVDSHFSHWAWANTPRKEGGIQGVSFPLVSDLNKTIAQDYGVLLPAGISLRGLFIINTKGELKHITVNHNDLGRSVDEVLRLLDAIDFTEEHGEVCPANWHKGEKAMKPTFDGLKAYASAK